MKPILFNTGMVRAILENRKTVTRRAVKLKYSNTHLEMFTNKYGTRLIEKQNEEPGVTTIKHPDGTTTHTLLACIEKAPPYRPGDTLYVRETWSRSMAGTYLYRATDIPFIHDRWNPSIHMPQEAARIFLRVTDVRVERLQDITPDQIDAEGCKEWAYSAKTGELLPSGPSWFRIAWDSTIKPADRALYGWEANPWVWVIEFERCERLGAAP